MSSFVGRIRNYRYLLASVSLPLRVHENHVPIYVSHGNVIFGVLCHKFFLLLRLMEN